MNSAAEHSAVRRIEFGAREWLSALLLPGDSAAALIREAISARVQVITTEREILKVREFVTRRLGFSNRAADQMETLIRDLAELPR